jgi:hypothetical protein
MSNKKAKCMLAAVPDIVVIDNNTK